MQVSTPVSIAAVSTSVSLASPLPKLTTVIGEKSSEPFPMINNPWDTFAGKGIRTVFVTIGASKSVEADLEIAEGLGCPINIVALNPTETAKWNEVTTILKERKRGTESVYDFSVGADTKWILPKNVRQHLELPWWAKGQVDLSGFSVNTTPLNEFLTSICSTMKIKDNITRIDILKIDACASAPGLEKAVLGAVLNSGFRPALILVNWSERPDVDLSTTIAAGHLQNAGYRLMDKIDNKFIYYFTDSDLYQLCSWEVTTCQNPLLNEIAKNVVPPTPSKSGQTLERT